MTSIKFKVTKTGQKRAYRYSYRGYRWLPMPLAEAEFLLATGNNVELVTD